MASSDAQRTSAAAWQSADIFRRVRGQEWAEFLVPKIVWFLLFGTALLYLLRRHGWNVTGGVLVGGFLALMVTRFTVAAAWLLILRPSRSLGYRRAARKLGRRLAAVVELTVQPMTWTHPSPGVFAISAAGELLFAGRSTGYRLLPLAKDEIACLTVDSDDEAVSLEIYYQRRIGGSVRCAVIPFGSDRRGAEAACLSIDRLCR